MEKYPYWNKYGMEVVKFKATGGLGTSFSGEPKYPNGYLLGIIFGHITMRLRHYKTLSFDEEIEVIKSVLKSGRANERYPLVDECGQVAIFKDNSYVFDTLTNGSFLGHLDTFSDELDAKDEKPIMVLPSEDMLGILEDFIRWKKNNAQK